MSGVVGLGSFLAGAVATFVADGEIGSGVLLAVGALFLLMASTARPITSAKIGDNEVQLARRLIRKVERKLDTAEPDVRAELAQAVLDAAPAQWRPVTQKAQWVLFEEKLRDELERLVPDAVIQKGRSVGNRGLDLLLRQGDVVVDVEVKLAARRLKWDTVLRVVEQSLSEGIKKLLIVASSGFTTGAHAALQEQPRSIQVELVQWSAPSESSQLARALQAVGLRLPTWAAAYRQPG